MALNVQQLTVMVNTMNEQIVRLNSMWEESQTEVVRLKQMAEQTREAVRMGNPGGGGQDRNAPPRQFKLIDQKSSYPDIFKDDRSKFRRWANRVTA